MSAPHMPMMNEQGFLNCPFCCSLRVEAVKDSVCTFIQCVECGSRSDDWFKKDTAVMKWNTRNGHLYTADDFNQAAEERDYGL